MPITNPNTRTRIDEIAPRVYRISTPVPEAPGGFSFNQYLLDDEEPLLFHTGPRKMSPLVREAIATVLPIERLRWISFSHYEADECGGLNELLAVAPKAAPLCGQIAAMVSIGDVSDRPPRALADGETISLGEKSVTWLDTPHLPHGWECGFLFEAKTKTLLSGDLFTQGGTEHRPLTDADILESSEAFRAQMDYFSHSRMAAAHIEKLARTQPRTLACMHGSAWTGDGAALLRALGERLTRAPSASPSR